jgi:tRNA G10  N-methylase Trm11
MSDIIKTVSNNQTEIIENILRLYAPNGIDCDPTYSIGNFYEKTGITKPKYKFDIDPQLPDVVQADARHLPLNNESIHCLMFDPPFLATTGKSLQNPSNNNKINRRFGVYPNEPALHQFYQDAIMEAHRILKPNGIFIFKCQDKVSGGKQYLSHVYIINKAIEHGFYPEDIFILTAKNRLIAKWQRNQRHARKYHCYFIVFRKSPKKINYDQT